MVNMNLDLGPKSIAVIMSGIAVTVIGSIIAASLAKKLDKEQCGRILELFLKNHHNTSLLSQDA